MYFLWASRRLPNEILFVYFPFAVSSGSHFNPRMFLHLFTKIMRVTSWFFIKKKKKEPWFIWGGGGYLSDEFNRNLLVSLCLYHSDCKLFHVNSVRPVTIFTKSDTSILNVYLAAYNFYGLLNSLCNNNNKKTNQWIKTTGKRILPQMKDLPKIFLTEKESRNV